MSGTDRADFEVTRQGGTCQRVGMPPGGPSGQAAVAITPALGPLPAFYIRQPPGPGATIRTFVHWVKGLRRSFGPVVWNSPTALSVRSDALITCAQGLAPGWR